MEILAKKYDPSREQKLVKVAEIQYIILVRIFLYVIVSRGRKEYLPK